MCESTSPKKINRTLKYPTEMKMNAKYKTLTVWFILGIVLLSLPRYALSQAPVRIYEADEVIPTYTAGPPDQNPMFFFGKQSQGAEGRIYPYPLYDNLTNIKSDKTYHVVYIENEFIRISILPEIGGRLFSALDKTNNYDFIYKHNVIKPALIGLIGAWISGGIEWNIPHHHRASTFIPVQWSREDNPDGSKTIWVGELEVRHRMRWAVGYTLYPGSSILECKMRFINRTPLEHTMLCFANVAVPPNDDYQVIFPPSTQYSTGHSKRSFQPWPVANNGLDVSWYKNNKNSASWFCVNDKEDFVAGFDHGINAGVMSVADRNIVPGKKFFTWGVGSMWDKILADDGRPYLEIMVGSYSDNQPDYSWLQPFEERSFELNFYPFRGIRGVKNANLDAAVNLEVKDGKAVMGFYATKSFTGATVTLKSGDKVLLEEQTVINPGKPYSKEVPLPAGTDEHDLRASLSAGGRELVAYSPIRVVPEPRPEGVPNTRPPEDYKIDEELFLAGQRIDEFHNPSLDADPYWLEVLRRDSSNVLANTGMGIISLRNAKYKEAEKYLNRAIKRLTAQYTNPKDVEPFYYLGVALKGQGRFDEAYKAFYKATWKEEWKSPGYFSLAEIAVMRGDFKSALNFVDRAIDANAYNLRAYGLKSAILRHLSRSDEAVKLLAFAKGKCDPLDVHLMAEQWLATKDPGVAKTLFSTMNSFPATAQETAAEYYNCGLWDDGSVILQQSITAAPNKIKVSPIVYYYLGHFAEKTGDKSKAAEYRKQAALQSSEYVFPFQDEVINVLNSAIAANPNDARASYYLGTLLYDWQPDIATALWEKSSVADPGFPITWRDLAVAYSHQKADDSQSKAIASLEKAVALNNPFPTHFVELDRLYQATNVAVTKRLALLEKNQNIVVKNDESLGDLITLKIFAGKAEESLKLLQSRTFSIWEGGTPFNSGQAWSDANLVLGLQLMKTKKYRQAVTSFEAALKPPENLRAEQRFDQRSVMLMYWTGCAYDGTGDKENAKQAWNEVISPTQTFRMGAAGGGVAAGGGMGSGNSGGTGTSTGRRTNEGGISIAQGEQIYYQTLAKQKLGDKEGSETAFNGLITSAMAALSQPEGTGAETSQGSRRQPARSNTAVAHYVAGLGYSGLGNKKKAIEEFNAALESSPDYLNAKIALGEL
jgi:tetratricopeptide (TPR) repeat protein